MKYYVIAGEVSGDMHAAKVVEQIKLKDTEAEFRGIGGDACIAQGLNALYHQKDIAFMGFFEVLMHLRTIAKVLKTVKSDIKTFRPDALLLVDYPGFNLRIAKYAHALGLTVHYYIAPKVWAWKEHRVKRIKQFVDHLYCILPFEEAYFSAKGIKVQYVGNPSKVRTEAFPSDNGIEKPYIALLPGSRAQEISKNMKTMLALVQHYPKFKFGIAQAPGFDATYYAHFGNDLELFTDMYELLSRSRVAVVTSGTATLETALLNVPQVVCYRTSRLTYAMAKRFIRIPYISLVNIILDRPLVRELIQADFTTAQLISEIDGLLEGELRLAQLKGYADLRSLLGDRDPAAKVSEAIVKDLS